METKKRNLWPFGVALSLILFAAGMVALIIISTSHRMQLVAADYYEQELAYQAEIDSLANTQQLQGSMQMTVDQTRRLLTLQLPIDHRAAQPVEGSIHLYRPSSAKLDQDRKLEVDVDGRQEIRLEGMESGLWKARMKWTFEGRTFRSDHLFVIAPGPAPSEEGG